MRFFTLLTCFVVISLPSVEVHYMTAGALKAMGQHVGYHWPDNDNVVLCT